MKKKVFRCLALALCITCLFGFAACNGKNETPVDKEDSPSNAVSAAAVEPTKESKVSTDSETFSETSQPEQSNENRSEPPASIPIEDFPIVESFESNEESDQTNDQEYADVQELMGAWENDGTIESRETQGTNDLRTLKITADRNVLIYTYTYNDLFGQENYEVADMLHESEDDFQATFSDLANTLSYIVAEPYPSVRLIYKAPDGTELYYNEFFAEQ